MAWTAANGRFLQQVRIYESRWTTIRLPKSTLSHHEELEAKDQSTEGPHSKNDGQRTSVRPSVRLVVTYWTKNPGRIVRAVVQQSSRKRLPISAKIQLLSTLQATIELCRQL